MKKKSQKQTKLSFCENVDSVVLTEQVNEKMIETTMDVLKCTRAQAKQVLRDAELQVVQKTIDSMVKKGLLEVVSYDPETKEARYVLTELGEQLSKT